MEQGIRRVTSRDVALAAGVSRQTVSSILNGSASSMVTEATRERVLGLAAEMGYVPNAAARQLRMQRANSVGLLLPSPTHYVTGTFAFSEFLTGISEVTDERGYDVVLCQRGLALPVVQMLQNGRVDGALLMHTPERETDLLELAKVGTRVVLMNRPADGMPFNWVDVDNCGGMRQATLHLLDRGHRRIGFISSWRRLLLTTLRLRGYHEALVARGLQPNDELVVFTPEPVTPRQGAAAMRRLLCLSERPTAVLCTGDQLAIGALSAVAEVGLQVPADIALVGMGDEPICAFQRPPLTTVRLPYRAKAQSAAGMLLDLIEDVAPGPNCLLLPAELVVRESA
ncbi:MAG: LacI family DNA-binding transcriptional regulator [Dehalococcoidales bacterium]|nr:LacI family DNA-binding transcriptional regulator [Dehalococcoidales bacterium]